MVVQYQRFADGVKERAGLSTAEEAREAIVEVVEAVVGHLDGVDQQQLATVLPGKIREQVNWEQPERSARTEGEFVEEVARQADVVPERARHLARAVLSELVAEEESLSESLRHRLPDEFAEVFSAPGQGPPPEWASAGADARPKPLDSDELSRALSELVGWEGTTAGISRLVQLPRDRFTPLLNQVKAAEKELSHHASIEERADGLELSLQTRSLGAVTELDLQLARRIDDAVDKVGSGG